MWSAAVDPRVITARALRIWRTGARIFDASDALVRALRGHVHEHLLIDRDGIVTRLDIIEGTALAGPVSLQFHIADDHHLEARISAVRAFTATNCPAHQHNLQLARRIHALYARDARDAGASLRETADLVLGPGDWPGDGEHRKSLVRRMIAIGEHMVRAGPQDALAGNSSPRVS